MTDKINNKNEVLMDRAESFLDRYISTIFNDEIKKLIKGTQPFQMDFMALKLLIIDCIDYCEEYNTNNHKDNRRINTARETNKNLN